MTEEKINYHRAADVVAKMTEQLSVLKMQMPVNLALALQATASSLKTAQEELSRWQARLEQPVDIVNARALAVLTRPEIADDDDEDDS